MIKKSSLNTLYCTFTRFYQINIPFTINITITITVTVIFTITITVTIYYLLFTITITQQICLVCKHDIAG